MFADICTEFAGRVTYQRMAGQLRTDQAAPSGVPFGCLGQWQAQQGPQPKLGHRQPRAATPGSALSSRGTSLPGRPHGPSSIPALQDRGFSPLRGARWLRPSPQSLMWIWRALPRVGDGSVHLGIIDETSAAQVVAILSSASRAMLNSPSGPFAATVIAALPTSPENAGSRGRCVHWLDAPQGVRLPGCSAGGASSPELCPRRVRHLPHSVSPLAMSSMRRSS